MSTRTVRTIALIAVGFAAIGAEAATARLSNAKRRSMLSLESSGQQLQAVHNVTTKGLLDCTSEVLENGVTGLAGDCVYGRYCGLGCSGEVDGVAFKAAPIDDLDRACFFHDSCHRKDESCRVCHCNDQLAVTSNQIFSDGAAAEGCGCGPGDTTCSNKLNEARTVYLYARYYETSQNCGTCSDAPVGDQCGATVAYETELDGSNYKDVSVAHWAECCSLCSDDLDCRAWTYSDGGCYMKSDNWTAISVKGYISGYY